MADSVEYLRAYAEHSKVLRTWLVAFGIGAPVLLVTNDAIWTSISTSGQGRAIALWYLVGVSLQVILATVNKVLMWGLYYGEETSSFKSRRRYRMAYWLSERLWIDCLFDLATLGVFVVATWKVLGILFV